MADFDPRAYAPAWTDLLTSERAAVLGPGEPNRTARPALAQLTIDGVFAPARVRDPSMAQLCIAGAWLLHGFLDESHEISQQIETSTGSYWHGIMHRREPDYSNSKYWFRRVGRHDVFEPLGQAAREIATSHPVDKAVEAIVGQSTWDAMAFVDLCAAVESGRSNSREFCLAVAQREWELLFDYCYRAALS